MENIFANKYILKSIWENTRINRKRNVLMIVQHIKLHKSEIFLKLPALTVDAYSNHSCIARTINCFDPETNILDLLCEYHWNSWSVWLHLQWAVKRMPAFPLIQCHHSRCDNLLCYEFIALFVNQYLQLVSAFVWQLLSEKNNNWGYSWKLKCPIQLNDFIFSNEK